jgi:hypothetical protein
MVLSPLGVVIVNRIGDELKAHATPVRLLLCLDPPQRRGQDSLPAAAGMTQGSAMKKSVKFTVGILLLLAASTAATPSIADEGLCIVINILGLVIDLCPGG